MSKYVSLQGFQSWMSEQQKDLSKFFDIGASSVDRFAGRLVTSKVSKNKLLERIETKENAEQLIEEFLSEGGTIVTTEEKKIKIEVASGQFYIPRFCVKLVKS